MRVLTQTPCLPLPLWRGLPQQAEWIDDEGVKWSVPQYERKEINAAGKCLIADENGDMEQEHIHKENDYISEPKDDGYRSYHLVYRYRSVATEHQAYNDLKIEIQLRSRLQHAWATAVETVGTFSGQPLKSGGGEQDWRRFFALMGSAIALRERCPLVPDTPSDKKELVKELRQLNRKLNVVTTLHGWRTSLKIAQSKSVPGTVAYLLEIDPEAWRVVYQGFSKDKQKEASELYLEREKDIRTKAVPGAQVVLASVSSLNALRSAFPNYYLDTRVFIEAVHEAVK